MGMAGTWLAFLVIFIIAKIGYSGSLVFYDSIDVYKRQILYNI